MSKQEKPSLEVLLSDEQFINLVNATVQKYAKTNMPSQKNGMIDSSELFSEAMLAITKSYNTFDPTYGIKFTTYAYNPMRNAILAYCRKFSHVLSIPEKESRTRLGELKNIPVVRLDDSPLDVPCESGQNTRDAKLGCDHILNGFNDFEKSVIVDRLVYEMPYSKIAEKNDICTKLARNKFIDLFRIIKSRAEALKNEAY